MKKIISIVTRILTYALNLAVLTFIVLPMIKDPANAEATLRTLWASLDASLSGEWFLSKLYFVMRDIWFAIGKIPYGEMIQEGIIAAISLETVGFFFLSTLRAIMCGLNRAKASIHNTSRMISGSTKFKSAARMSKDSFDRDAEGYKNFHPGEKGPDDNVPEELKKVVGIESAPVVDISRARRMSRYSKKG